MKRNVLLLLWLPLLTLTMQAAPDYYPSVAPTGTFINHDGEEEELTVGGTYDAPLTVTFTANPTDTAGYIIYYEWKILKKDDKEETTLAVRNDEVTEFTFREEVLASRTASASPSPTATGRRVSRARWSKTRRT